MQFVKPVYEITQKKGVVYNRLLNDIMHVEEQKCM